MAGLAAAEGLSRQGLEVVLYEARTRLGGRATSFDDKKSQSLVDNCQHVSMGCCTNLQSFCAEVGIAHSFRIEPELTFIDRDGGLSPFAANGWPAPFHLTQAFLGLRYFSWADRLQIATGLRRLAAEKRFDGPFLHWLYSAGQSERVRRLFWHVILVSALSESLDRIATQAARKVFVDGFFGNNTGWQVHVPTVELDDLYGSPVIEALSARGVHLERNSAIRTIAATQSAGFEIELRSGEKLSAETCIVAVPHHRLADLMGEGLESLAAPRAAGRLESAPITSVHLWFDRPISKLPHAVFVDHLSQWMFQKPSTDESHYYQVVISASHELESRDRCDVVDEVVADLTSAFPTTAEAELLHSRVVTEKRAVFSPTPESQQIRPQQRSEQPGLYFAGDWTATGWPATMEGAVLSGYLAAEAVLEDRGQPAPLVSKPLPPSLLSRVLGFS